MCYYFSSHLLFLSLPHLPLTVLLCPSHFSSSNLTHLSLSLIVLHFFLQFPVFFNYHILPFHFPSTVSLTHPSLTSSHLTLNNSHHPFIISPSLPPISSPLTLPHHHLQTISSLSSLLHYHHKSQLSLHYLYHCLSYPPSTCFNVLHLSPAVLQEDRVEVSSLARRWSLRSQLVVQATAADDGKVFACHALHPALHDVPHGLHASITLSVLRKFV